MTVNPSAAVDAILASIVDTVRAFPDGVPSSYLYLEFNRLGCDLQTYNLMIELLVKEGKITNSNHLLRIVP